MAELILASASPRRGQLLEQMAVDFRVCLLYTSMSEVFTGLQTKAIDGLEFAGTSVVGQKFYEVAKYYSDIDWQWCSSANFQVSRKALSLIHILTR